MLGLMTMKAGLSLKKKRHFRSNVMPCDKECNQGRNCDCKNGNDAIVVITVLIFILIVSAVYGLWYLFKGAI